MTSQKPESSPLRLRGSHRMAWLFAIPIVFTCLLSLACDTYGTKKMFNGTELYYTSAVTEKEVDKLGAWLITEGFADGEEKSVQLNKTGNTYEFRIVVKKGLHQDRETIDYMKELGMYLRSVFDGANVDVHMCDERLKTLRVVPAPDWDNHDEE